MILSTSLNILVWAKINGNYYCQIFVVFAITIDFQADSFIYSEMRMYLSRKYLFCSDYVLVAVLNIEDIAFHLGRDERNNE